MLGLLQMGGRGYEYPRAGKLSDGRTVGKDIPNTNSIAATVPNYKSIGVRDVPLSAFTLAGPPPRKLDARTMKLAEEIKASKQINPLIVAMDKQGPYIVEGGHRFDALRYLGAKSFPALVVRDLDELP
jgi:hypothetical protein